MNQEVQAELLVHGRIIFEGERNPQLNCQGVRDFSEQGDVVYINQIITVANGISEKWDLSHFSFFC